MLAGPPLEGNLRELSKGLIEQFEYIGDALSFQKERGLALLPGLNLFLKIISTEHCKEDASKCRCVFL